MIIQPEIYSLEELEIPLSEEVRGHLTDQYKATYNGDESAAMAHLDLLMISMKTATTQSICRVNQIRATREEVIEGLKQELHSWDPSEDFPIHKHPILEDVVVVGPARSLAPDQILVKRRIPPRDLYGVLFANWPSREQRGWPMTHRVVICDRFCGEAVLRGSDIFVRGILSADAGVSRGEKVCVYADIRDSSSSVLVPRGQLLEKYEGRCVFLGLGTACCSRAEIFSKSKGVAIKMSAKPEERAGPVLPPFHGVLPSQMMLQNLCSIVVGHALAPHSDDVILDMCCAPGGKTSHVASLVRNQAIIVACDKSRKKMVTAKAFFQTMGATCITPLALDSTQCVIRAGERTSVSELLALARPSERDGLLDVKGFYPESFDRILLDPPCSALGLRPKLEVPHTTVEKLKRHTRYQRMFVKEAVDLLKPNGILTYSTCTIHALENESMVRSILDEFPCLELVPITFDVGLPGLKGHGLNDIERGYVRRFDSAETADTMGFFLAKFRKKPATNG